jgi:hypothetical protein
MINIEMSILGICLGLGVLGAGCHGRAQITTRDVNDSLEQAAVSGSKDQLSVSLRVMRVLKPDDRPVVEGEVLHHGDEVYLLVRTNQQAFLNIVLFSPDGTTSTLFPTEKYQLVPGNCAVRIPTTRTLNVTDPPGIEDLRVLASLRPLAEVDRRLCEELRLNCTAEAQTKKPEVAPCDTGKYTFRGLVRSVKTARADTGGVALTRFPLRHEP